MSTLFVRIYVDGHGADAEEAASRMQRHLETAGWHVGVMRVAPYWKIPGYTELCLEIAMQGSAAETTVAATKQLGTGWTLRRPGEAIWNIDTTSIFIEPSVRWAHIEALEES